MILEKYKFLLFDLDDTLLDFQKAQLDAFSKLLKNYNIEFSNQIFNRYKEINSNLWYQFELGELSNKEVVEKRFSNFFEELGMKVAGADADKLYRKYLTEGNQLFEGVKPMLEKLKSSHVLCVASNGIANTQYKRLATNKIDKYFEKVFISEELGSKKPEKQFFETIFSELNITNKKEVLIIGDNLNADILGGQIANIDTCWINKSDEICSLSKQPTYTLKNVTQLMEL